MEIILLERISRLGGVGDVVKVKNGYARNYLIPQEKALRASKENKEAFEARRDALEAKNNDRKAEAQKIAEKMEGLVVTVVRQAADDGKLYGSVAVRDVADALEAEGQRIDRRLIDLNQAIKSLGLYEVTVNLHPEVPVVIKVHVARNADSPLPEEMQEPPQAEAGSELSAQTDGEAEAEATDTNGDTETDEAHVESA